MKLSKAKLNKAKLNKGRYACILEVAGIMAHPERQKNQRIQDLEPRGAPALKEIAKMREWNLGGQGGEFSRKESHQGRNVCYRELKMRFEIVHWI